MTEYEHILIFAVRYALGRRTYAVEVVTRFVAKEILNLSERCRITIAGDIHNQDELGYGGESFRRD